MTSVKSKLRRLHNLGKHRGIGLKLYPELVLDFLLQSINKLCDRKKTLLCISMLPIFLGEQEEHADSSSVGFCYRLEKAESFDVFASLPCSISVFGRENKSIPFIKYSGV